MILMSCFRVSNVMDMSKLSFFLLIVPLAVEKHEECRYHYDYDCKNYSKHKTRNISFLIHGFTVWPVA